MESQQFREILWFLFVSNNFYNAVMIIDIYN